MVSPKGSALPCPALCPTKSYERDTDDDVHGGEVRRGRL